MTTSEDLSQSTAKELLTQDRDQLYELLGARLRGIQDDISQQGLYEPSIVYEKHLGPREDLLLIGRRMFNKTHIQAYGLVCGSDPDDEKDRNKIITALGIGTEAAVIAVSSVLIGTFGLAAALAGVVAALIIKRFAEPTLQEGHAAMCELWKEHLPKYKIDKNDLTEYLESRKNT